MLEELFNSMVELQRCSLLRNPDSEGKLLLDLKICTKHNLKISKTSCEKITSKGPNITWVFGKVFKDYLEFA